MVQIFSVVDREIINGQAKYQTGASHCVSGVCLAIRFDWHRGWAKSEKKMTRRRLEGVSAIDVVLVVSLPSVLCHW